MKKRILIFLARIRDLLWRWRPQPLYTIIRLSEVPDRPKPNRLYLIGEGKPWAAAVLCPCGCRALIQLSLLKNDSPVWRLSIDHRGAPTLSPSVQRVGGCNSHFYLRKGRIHWSH